MSPLMQRPRRKSGDFVKATIAPANVLLEPRFGVLDGVIVAALLLALSGVLYWILG